MTQPIELRKARDFGQIINDTFTFLKENFKPLFKALLIICGLFILIGTATTVFQYMSMIGIYRRSANFNSASNYEVSSYTYSYLMSVLFNFLVLVLLEVGIHLVTLAYISVYLQKGNVTPTFEEVWGYFKYYFWRVIGSGTLCFFLAVIGCFLCIIPGIYLGNVFSLVIPIIVIENSSFRYAFNKSFQLIKNNWWFLFGITIITSLIVGIAGSFANIPISIITLTGSFFSQKSYTLPLLIIFSALKNILMLAYALPVISIALCYFKLSEEKEGTGLLGRIANFGKSTDTPTLPTEEY